MTKFFSLILLSMFVARSASAQLPVIDSMDIDESTSTLLIHGIHGTEAGTVQVDGIPLTVQFWTDTLITCSMPESGKGSCGPVIVGNSHGSSKPRLITKWHYNIFGWHAPPNDPFAQVERERFYLDWRFDLHSRLLAKVGYTRAYLTPMRSSWHVDTIQDGHTFHQDTIIESPYTNGQIILWYLHDFQDGSASLMSIQNQSGICLFDSNFKIRPYHDTVKDSRGVWIAEHFSNGSVEFAPPPQAVWLMEPPSLKYESINHLNNLVKLQWWVLPWAEQYELRVTRVSQPDSGIAFDTTFASTTTPLVDVSRIYPDGLYHWAVRMINSEGPGVWSARSFGLGDLGVEEVSTNAITLLENPVHSTMRFLISENTSNFNLRLFDALGRECSVNGTRSDGRYEVNVSGLPSGVYSYDFSIGTSRSVGRVVVER